MSYILDALKKNKSNDDKSDVPDLSSEHAYHEFEEEKSFQRWLWPIIVMVLVLTIAVLIFMLVNPSAKEFSETVVEKKQPTATSVAQDKVITKEESNTANDSLTEMSGTEVINKPLQVAEPVVKKVRRSAKQERVSNSQSVAADQPRSVSKARAVTKADLPQLVYTTHIYATQPKDRFVMLNGKAYAQGDSISSELRIKEILENDLVVIYKGQEFILPSLEDVNVD